MIMPDPGISNRSVKASLLDQRRVIMLDTTQYPMTASQQVLIFADKFQPSHAWVNIAAAVDFQNDIDEKKMLQAISISLMRTPSANIRIHKNEDKTYTQYFSHELISGIDYMDFSSLTQEKYEKTIEKWAKTPFPNKGIDTQLVIMRLLRRPDGFCTLFLCVDHMVADAYTIMNTIRYIFNTYKALVKGTDLPKELPSPIALYEAEKKYYQSEKFKNDIQFWTDYYPIDDEPYYTSLAGKKKKSGKKKDSHTEFALIPYLTKGKQTNLPIPKEIVDGVMSFAAEWRVSPQSFYHLGLYTYLAAVNEIDDVVMANAVARRATLVQKRAGGTLVNPVMVRCKIDRKATTFKDACGMVYHNINEVYRHADLPYGLASKAIGAKFGNKPGVGYAGIGLCYQPYFNLQDEDMTVNFRRLDTGYGSQACYLTIMPYDNSGALWCNYEHVLHFYSVEVIEKTHKFLVNFLHNALANPDKTLAELTDMSM